MDSSNKVKANKRKNKMFFHFIKSLEQQGNEILKEENLFQFLISKDKYQNLNKKEQELFLLANNIYILSKNIPTKERNEFITKSYRSEFYAYTELNDAVLHEIIKVYLSQRFIRWHVEDFIHEIKNELINALDIEEKGRIIRRTHKKYVKKLKKLKIAIFYTDVPKEQVRNNNERMVEYVKSEISDDLIINYITQKVVNFEEDKIFRNWSKVEQFKSVLKFLKGELNTISNPIDQKIEKTKTPITFNDIIFRTKEAQKWFHDTLIEMGAINEENKAQKGVFQTRCQAIFSISECKNKIFKNRLKLKDYIEYLNITYSAKITNNSRLSDGYKYKADVKKYLNLFKNK